jgi:release factor glutamine methyltransferase
MKVQQLFQKFSKDLPRLELEVLFCFVTKQNREFFLKNPDFELTPSQAEDFSQLVLRRLNNEPIAYIIQQKEFYGQNFFVTPHVLIPRPETEELVELAIESLKDSQSLKILDIGTGSGAIACTLATHLPNSQVTALDISHQALEVALKNSQKQNLTNITFLESNFLDEIEPNASFDLIITNPPYVKTSDKPEMAKETVTYEPELALYSGSDGLDAYRQIFKQIKQKNIQFKFFYGEFGYNQEKELKDLLEIHFSGKYILLKDLANIVRFVKIEN